MSSVSPEQQPLNTSIHQQEQEADSVSKTTRESSVGSKVIASVTEVDTPPSSSSTVSITSSIATSSGAVVSAAVAKYFNTPKKFVGAMTVLWDLVSKNNREAIRVFAKGYMQHPPYDETPEQRREFLKTLLVIGEKELLTAKVLEYTLTLCSLNPVDYLLGDLLERNDPAAIKALLHSLTNNPPTEFPIVINSFLRSLVETHDEQLLCCSEMIRFLSSSWQADQAHTFLDTVVGTGDQVAIKAVIQWLTIAPPQGFSVWGRTVFFTLLFRTGDIKLLTSPEVKAFIENEWTGKNAQDLLATLFIKNEIKSIPLFFQFIEKHPPQGFSIAHKCKLLEYVIMCGSATMRALKEIKAVIRTTCNSLPHSVARTFIESQILRLITPKESIEASAVKALVQELSEYRAWDLEAKIRALARAEAFSCALLSEELKKDRHLAEWFERNKETRHFKILVEWAKSTSSEAPALPPQAAVSSAMQPQAIVISSKTGQEETQQIDIPTLAERCATCEKNKWSSLCQQVTQTVHAAPMTQFLKETERLISSSSCTDAEYAFCRQLVGALLRADSSVSLTQAQVALGALVYFHDTLPSKIPTSLSNLEQSVSALTTALSDHFKAIFETEHPSSIERASKTIELRIASGKKMSFLVPQVDENGYAQKLGNILVGADGKINILLLSLMEQQLLQPASLRGDFDNHMGAVFHKLRSDEIPHTILEEVHCSKDETINESIIRPTVGVPIGTPINDLHAKKALVIATLLFWRQREFGSCSVNAVSLSAQELYISSFMQDMAALLEEGSIVRQVEEEAMRFIGIPPKKSFLFDMPIDSRGATKNVMKLLNSIPQMEEALILAGAMEREDAHSLTYLEKAIEAAKEQKTCTLRSILSLLPKNRQIDLARFEFLLGTPIFRMFEHALASLPFTSFATNYKYSNYDQQKFITIVLAAVYDLLSSTTFKDLPEERLMTFVSTLPQQMKSALYNIWALQQGQCLSQKEGMIGSLITKLDADYPALRRLRFFAKAPYEVEGVAHANPLQFCMQLYEETNEGGFTPVDETRFQAIVHDLVEQIVEKIAPSYSVPSFTLEATLQKYRPFLFEKKLNRGEQHEEEIEFQDFENRLLEQGTQFTQFFSVPLNVGGVIYETYVQKKKDEEQIACDSAETMMRQLIRLSEKVHASRRLVPENFVSSNSVHCFRTFLHQLPGEVPQFTPKDFPLEQAQGTVKKLKKAVISAIAKQKKVPQLEVELFLERLAVPKATSFKEFWTNLNTAIHKTKWLKDITWTKKNDDMIMEALLDGLDEEFAGNKKDRIIPFADTNWVAARYGFFYNPLEEKWHVGVFTEKGKFQDMGDADFGAYSVALSSLPEVQNKERIITQGQLQDEVTALAEQFVFAWTEFQKHKPTAREMGPLAQELFAAKSIDEMIQVVQASKYKKKRYLYALFSAKKAYDQKLAELLRNSNPPITDPLQPVFAVCFGRTSAMREALLGDAVSLVSSLLPGARFGDSEKVSTTTVLNVQM